MRVEIKGTLNTEATAALNDIRESLRPAAEAQWRRVLDLSRLAGREIVYQWLGKGYVGWVPVVCWPSEYPVAWMHTGTGERREGPDLPESDGT